MRPVVWITLFLAALTESAAALVQSEEIARFPAEEAHQAVAVDAEHFYAIANTTIGKYHKETGTKLAMWEDTSGGIPHMNAGVVIDGVLYATASNYPAVPMASSIEMFDAETLTHIGSHSFGIYVGSALWLQQHGGYWWVAFGHYDERGGTPGKDHTYSQIVKFDDQWRRVGAYIYPPDLLEKFKPMTNSGATIGDDGLIYATAHHNHELYVLDFPDIGPVLEFNGTIPATSYGQGIAWDPSTPRTLYTIRRDTKEVIVYQVPRLTGAMKPDQ